MPRWLPGAASAEEVAGADVWGLLLLSAGAGEAAVSGAAWLRGRFSWRDGVAAACARLAAGFCGVAGAGAGAIAAGAGGVSRDSSSTWVACGMAGAAVMSGAQNIAGGVSAVKAAFDKAQAGIDSGGGQMPSLGQTTSGGGRAAAG